MFRLWKLTCVETNENGVDLADRELIPIFVLIHSERFATVGTFINFLKYLIKVRKVLQAFEIHHLLYEENYFI